MKVDARKVARVRELADVALAAVYPAIAGDGVEVVVMALLDGATRVLAASTAPPMTTEVACAELARVLGNIAKAERRRGTDA